LDWYWIGHDVLHASRGGSVTALLALDRSDAAVHVLIIAVGRYADKDLKPLPGAVLSAERLAEFWRDAPLAGGRQLGSIELLVSSEKPLEMIGVDGVKQVIEPATFDAVGKAIQDWADRCSQGAMGIFHWIGHGETVSLTDEAGANNDACHALYTEDLYRLGDQVIRTGYHWGNTLRDLQRVVPKPMLCFIDACSHAPEKSRDEGFSSVFRMTKGPIKSRADVFLSTRPGAKAHSAREDQDVGGDFVGGALFSEGVRLALTRFGADERDEEGYAVFPDFIKRAADSRFGRWRRRHGELKDLGEVFVVQGAFSKAVVKLAAPFGMVDLVPHDRRTKNKNCEVMHDKVPRHEPRRANDLWEADLPYERDYRASIMENPGFAREVQEPATKLFAIHSPHRRLEVI
tara:strand:+ start:31073 stop:32278 length:1206 start_codon:yes stop_codon:yes gene_type:complete